MQPWDEVESFLLAEASADLAQGPDVRPCLLAYAGEEPLLVAFLRSFRKGQYDDAVIELLALAMPLGADRLALSIAARAWSLDDPIPPVLAGVGDLRQRVLSINQVDGTAEPVAVSNALHPFTSRTEALRQPEALGPCTEGVHWDEPVRNNGATGWLVSALRLAVEQCTELVAPHAEIRKQARRCVALGHLLAFADGGLDRMGLDAGAEIG